MQRILFMFLLAANIGCIKSGENAKPVESVAPPNTDVTESKPNMVNQPRAKGEAPKEDAPKPANLGTHAASDDKLRAALKLCGKDYYELSITYSFKEFDIDTVHKLAKEVLFDKGTDELAERFPLAVEKVAAQVPKGRFQIRTSKQVPLKDIQDILGEADSTTKDSLEEGPAPFGGTPKRIPIVWHNYGWCCFGANDRGIVLWLKAECSGLKR